jgi:four helix bundle suffix protein
MMAEPLIPKHGGYRKLKSFQVSEVVYDLTVRFCKKYVDRFSRTRDQMVQAARSGRQNIAEGSMASATSKKTELKLTGVAKASLEELRLDYEDYLRQHKLPLWDRQDPRRVALIDARPQSADDVAKWAVAVKNGGQSGPGGQNGHRGNSKSTQSTASTQSTFAEIAANGAIALIAVATALLDRQMQAQAADFEKEGGFTERLYRTRTQARRETQG